MAITLYGDSPTRPEGKFIRLSIWKWHPMWNYFEINSPELAGFANKFMDKGRQFSQHYCLDLASEVVDDMVAKYISDYNGFLDGLPKIVCPYCFGQRVQIKNIIHKTDILCTFCNGEGTRKMPICDYVATESSFIKFKDFLNACGGMTVG